MGGNGTTPSDPQSNAAFVCNECGRPAYSGKFGDGCGVGIGGGAQCPGALEPNAASERDALPYGGHFGGFPYGAAESGLAPWWDEEEDDSVLGYCPHGVNLDREFCPKGCRV